MEDKSYQERQQIAVQYVSRRRLYTLVEFGLTTLLFVVVFVFSKQLTTLFDGWAPFWTALMYFIILAIAYFIVVFPVQYIRNYHLAKDVGLLKQTFAQWFGDYLKMPLLILILGGLAFGLLHLLIMATPTWWWLWVSLALTVLSFTLSVIYPAVIMPFSYKTQSLTEGPIKEVVDDIIKYSGIPVSRVDILKISNAEESSNAMMVGLGKTRRIVLTDTLLNDYTPSEIQVICAHELGHIKEGHFWKSFLLSLALTVATLFLTSLVASLFIGWFSMGDITTLSAMPLILLVFLILYVISTVFANIYLRKEEAQADLYALRLTNNPDAFTSMLRKLVSQNLDKESSEMAAENLMYDHPLPASRLAMAQAYKEGQYERK